MGKPADNNETTMKNNIKLLLAAAIAISFAAVNSAKADEPLLSPRAQANQINRISGTDSGPNLVSGNYLGTAAKWQASGAVAPSSSGNVNLVNGTYVGAAVKDPIRESRKPQFEIAPLATPGK